MRITATRVPAIRSSWLRGLLALLLAGVLLLAPGTRALAHQSSESYLRLGEEGPGLVLRWDIALRDLDALVTLDLDDDGRLTWGEVRRGWPRVLAAAQEALEIDGCPLAPSADAGPRLERRSDGVYAVLSMESSCAPPADPTLHYTLLAGIDPTHRGLASILRPGRPPELQLLDPERGRAVRPGSIETATATATDPASARPTPFLLEGVHHIVTGYDHVLFLLCLIVGCVMSRDGRGRWQPVERLGQALWPVAGVVTAFTLAHSITLALAALGRVSMPPAVIEPAIAATIVLAAVDNLRPIFHGRRTAVAFLFGLVHGFGFAGVLAELELPADALAWALLQFNLGLELGQLVIVFGAASLLYLARRRPAYPRWVIGLGSIGAMAVGTAWFVERALESVAPP